MPKPTKRSFSFEFKLEVVRRYLGGETKVSLAQEFDLSSPKLVETWARLYRNGGDDALRPKAKGRPRSETDVPEREESELTRLRRENERLKARQSRGSTRPSAAAESSESSSSVAAGSFGITSRWPCESGFTSRNASTRGSS